MAFGNNKWADAMNASKSGVGYDAYKNNTSSRGYTPYSTTPSGLPQGFGQAPRTVGGALYEEVRDQHGLKIGDIITLPGRQRIEARDASGILLGWYLPMYNLTYDARTNSSMAQGNVLSGLLLNNGTRY